MSYTILYTISYTILCGFAVPLFGGVASPDSGRFNSCLHFVFVSVRIRYISPVKILVWTFADRAFSCVAHTSCNSGSPLRVRLESENSHFSRDSSRKWQWWVRISALDFDFHIPVDFGLNVLFPHIFSVLHHNSICLSCIIIA